MTVSTDDKAGHRQCDRVARPVILTFVDQYLPGYRAGGPIRTIAHMVDQLGEDFDFRIVTSDRDLGDTAPYDSVDADVWTACGKAHVFYRSSGAAGWRALFQSIRFMHFDVIYLNSFFSVATSLQPLTYRRLGRLGNCPVLLAPRGEFSAGALALKAAKKRAFIALARATGMFRGVTFQASSEYEAQDIRRVMGAARVAIAPDLSGRSLHSAPPRATRRPGAPTRGVFLSRISPKKNLAGALEILAGVSCPVDFSIYGTVEDAAYWKLCQRRIASLPAHVSVRYHGEVRPEVVEEVLSGHDFFFLPTFGENYGHVIREALSSGLPVLISDQTPWRDLVALNAGCELPLDDSAGFVAWIEAFAELDSPVRYAMQQAARRMGDDPVVAARNLESNKSMLYETLPPQDQPMARKG